jgi:hypothetical protein
MVLGPWSLVQGLDPRFRPRTLDVGLLVDFVAEYVSRDP